MGAVYQAKDIKRQGTICAIKEMSLSMVPPEERVQAIENFKIEAKILWDLKHPNLPELFGFFSENQRYFLVMEFIDGLTLEELLERNDAPFSERRVLGWARQLCDVLEYLHSQSPPIIFRDMKPGNIMLTRNGQIKLIDFGIARFFRSTDAHDTQLLGTPGYAPPEQYGKAQTDERSDIYALGMTLFQLLTNTLSEKGFGLQDVRAVNPQISPTVAHALEKATALELDDRYENVATFRRALFDEGSFMFENGDVASTPEELAELCMHFPEEAADYLSAGEIELWLHEIGEEKLSRTAVYIRTTIPDPQLSVKQFLHAVLGQNLHARSYSANGATVTVDVNAAVAKEMVQQTTRPRTQVPRWLTRKQTTLLKVSPRKLDFGQVYPGVSAPLLITISGYQGIRGSIRVSESCIKVDRTQFDGAYTAINVRINSMLLQSNTSYAGEVVVVPDDASLANVAVKVEANIMSYAAHAHRGKTVVPDLDDEEDEEDVPSGQLAFSQKGPVAVQQVPAHTYNGKYAQAGLNGTQQWDPGLLTSAQHMWQLRGLTFVAAFMLASLFYTLFIRPTSLPLPPDPRFIAVLTGMILTAPLGALLVNWRHSWSLQETTNRALTGMGSVLLLLALARVIWQLLLHINLGALQLCIMLLCAAAGACAGVDARVSKYIIDNMRWMLQYASWFMKPTAVILGAGLGYLLTVGLALGSFTIFGMLVGIAVLAALVWQVDHLLKLNRP